jgi:hypothetical protein
MSDKQPTNIEAADLPAALYLNQRLVFDMLASYEDGFSQLRNIQLSSSASAESEHAGQASLGTGNVFALLGITFGGSTKKAKSEDESQVISEQRVHTPTSLFSRLRKHLIVRGALKYPGGIDSLADIAPGDFVEIKAVLKRSPLVSALSGMARLVPLITALEKPAAPLQQSRGKGHRPTPAKAVVPPPVKGQIEALLEAVRAEGSEDLIGTSTDGLTIVLGAELSHFVDPTLNDVIDGEFRVLGKVTRVVAGPQEPAINLLRKTTMAMFGDEIVDQFTQAFAQAAQAGAKIPPVETNIKGPALQVIPIAIFA